MSKITFYLDEMGKRAVVEGLKQRGYEAVLAVDLGPMLRVLSQFADERTAEQVAGQVFWLKA